MHGQKSKNLPTLKLSSFRTYRPVPRKGWRNTQFLGNSNFIIQLQHISSQPTTTYFVGIGQKFITAPKNAHEANVKPWTHGINTVQILKLHLKRPVVKKSRRIPCFYVCTDVIIICRISLKRYWVQSYFWAFLYKEWNWIFFVWFLYYIHSSFCQ